MSVAGHLPHTHIRGRYSYVISLIISLIISLTHSIFKRAGGAAGGRFPALAQLRGRGGAGACVGAGGGGTWRQRRQAEPARRIPVAGAGACGGSGGFEHRKRASGWKQNAELTNCCGCHCGCVGSGLGSECGRVCSLCVELASHISRPRTNINSPAVASQSSRLCFTRHTKRIRRRGCSNALRVSLAPFSPLARSPPADHTIHVLRANNRRPSRQPWPPNSTR